MAVGVHGDVVIALLIVMKSTTLLLVGTEM